MTQELISRQEEITSKFLMALDNHLTDIVQGRADYMMEINEIAEQLNIHPTHLSNTVRLATGKSACSFYEHKIINIAKSLLEQTQTSITDIAHTLTYDPSNFTKFFKAYVNKTPKQYRKDFLKK
jgi:AraC family transcriptional regulator, regulatory protein of adaptative response / methylphosphotriester-DNA alkyltransferase methyltransferase